MLFSAKSLIPELNVPYKKNVWFENMQMVRDSLLILTPDDLSRLPANKSLILDRSSGYQVCIHLMILGKSFCELDSVTCNLFLRYFFIPDESLIFVLF